MEIIIKWLSGNYIELLGAILGFIYIFLSIRQNIWTWPVGLLTSSLYVWVFLNSQLYADMGLQMYYVVISIYGWYEWLKGNTSGSSKELMISRLQVNTGIILAVIAVLVLILIWFVLKNYTDSPVPFADSLATSLSIIATWMLARKILEHWVIWIFVDAFSIGLFLYKELYPTVILFVIYTIMAIAGYFEWKKVMKAERGKV
jgi:nicotinamide mononucleotide transporter